MLSVARSSSVPDWLPAHLSRSWERCHGLGLRRDMPTPLEPLATAEVDQLLRRNESLLKASSVELQYLTPALAGTGHVAFVVDYHGFIVAIAGDLQNAGPVLQRLQCGVNLSETRCGTNAAGTVLVEQRPTLVQRSEHYLSELSALDCFAAPIVSPRGQLLGALTVSSSNGLQMSGVTDLIQIAAARIERELVRNLASPFLMRLHPHADGLGSVSEGMLAIGVKGDVIGMNPSAARILGLDATRLEKCSLDSIFETNPFQTKPFNSKAVLKVRGGLSLSTNLSPNPLASAASSIRVMRSSASTVFSTDLRLVEGLSVREMQVLGHLQCGLSNFQMAQRMSVTENAIKYHLKNIFSKLRARTRLEAIKIARELGAIA